MKENKMFIVLFIASRHGCVGILFYFCANFATPIMREIGSLSRPLIVIWSLSGHGLLFFLLDIFGKIWYYIFKIGDTWDEKDSVSKGPR